MKGEDLEQAFLIEWCKMQENAHPELKMIFAIPNGGKRDIKTATKLKKTGVKSGVPDLMLAVPKNGKAGLFIEMKYGKNKPSQNQKEWLKLLAKQGYETKVCYSAEEAIKIIKEYLNI